MCQTLARSVNVYQRRWSSAEVGRASQGLIRVLSFEGARGKAEVTYGVGPRSGSEPGRVPGVGDSADCRASERGRAGFVPGVLLTPAACPSGCRVLSPATSRPLEQSPVRSRYLNTFRVENPPSFHSATKGIAATGWRRTPASGDLETCEEHLKTGPNLLCSQEGGRFWS